MFKAMEKAISAFTKQFIQFIYGSFLAFFLNLITIGALLGFLLIVYYTLSTFNVLNGNIILIAIILTIISIVYLVIANGLKGALIKTYQSIMQGERPHASYYLNYALGNGEVFLLITIVKLIFMAIVLSPLAGLYFLVLNGSGNILVNVVFVLFGLFLVFLMEFPFPFAYISAALDERGVIYAIKQGFKFVIKKNIGALGLFFIYAISWVFLLIPLLQIASFLALYPLTYTSLIVAYRDFGSGVSRAPAPISRKAPQAKFAKKPQRQRRKEEYFDDYSSPA